ncbi:hypothetical protein B7494_g6806 [Chlorociboria aeruginascens]|nr:hypothetical protein B7494_g6806 [Chlorociboria aeruginascens]
MSTSAENSSEFSAECLMEMVAGPDPEESLGSRDPDRIGEREGAVGEWEEGGKEMKKQSEAEEEEKVEERGS